MAKWIKADNTVKAVNPKNGTDFTLEELQFYVGGYIEIVPIVINEDDKRYMVVNEEGQLYRLPFNMRASMIAGCHIVGDVLLCSQSQIR